MDVSALMQGIYDGFLERLEAREGMCLPGRRYFHLGEIAHDCAQFTVSANSISQRIFGNTMSSGRPIDIAAISTIEVEIAITRDVPMMNESGEAPSVKSLTGTAKRQGDDGSALYEAFYEVMRGDWVKGYCTEVTFEGVRWEGPFGGVASTILTTNVQL